MTPRGIRQNNPGNIRPSSIVWQGQTGSQNGYLVFDTPKNGLRALAKDLLYKYRERGLRTVRSIVTRYAPEADQNNTEAYIVHVCDVMRVGDMEQLDLSNKDTLLKFMKAVVCHENGGCPYSDGLIYDAILSATGEKTVPPITTSPPPGSEVLA